MADKLSNNRLVVTYEFNSQKERDDAENYAVEMKKGFFGEPGDSFTGHIISTEVSSRKIYLEPQEPQQEIIPTRELLRTALTLAYASLRPHFAANSPTLAQEPRSEPEQGTRIAIVKRSFNLNDRGGVHQENRESSISIEELVRLLRNVDYSRAEAIPGPYSDNSRKEGQK